MRIFIFWKFISDLNNSSLFGLFSLLGRPTHVHGALEAPTGRCVFERFRMFFWGQKHFSSKIFLPQRHFLPSLKSISIHLRLCLFWNFFSQTFDCIFVVRHRLRSAMHWLLVFSRRTRYQGTKRPRSRSHKAWDSGTWRISRDRFVTPPVCQFWRLLLYSVKHDCGETSTSPLYQILPVI